ncbi:MAG: oligoendopeptidase F [Peptococcaceae bacterium]|nr:oligoendopeptidase F [Peptococcaceae bacterium]
METGAIPGRAKVPKKYKWRLEDIYASDELWERDFTQTKQLAVELAGFQGKLGESANNLLTVLECQERVQELLEKVFIYARMRRDEENSNPVYQALADRASLLGAEVGAALAFVEPEILAIDQDTLNSFRQTEPGLEKYGILLDEILRFAPHTLSKDEEQLLAQASDALSATRNIFTMINNADITFPAIEDEHGNQVEVTHGRYIQLMENKDRRIRKDAFTSLYSAYGKLTNTLATTYSNSVKKDIFYTKARKYPSAIEASLFADNVPISVYDNLITVVRNNLDSMYRYVALRKKMLGLSELHMYDLYTPMVKDVLWEVPYKEATKIVREALAPLGKSYGKIMAKGLSSGWVDVYESKAKTSGAYSWGPYGVHPYILMNYQDNLNSVFTLAHELGHAMHSYYAYQEQPYVYAHYKIFTAEVASTVNETLLINHLLKSEPDRNRQLYLLNHYLEEFRGTVFRQTMFAEFEKIIHEKAEAGEALTPNVLSEVYRSLNIDYYGPETVIDPEIDLEWSRIPHFYNAFYVYKYATGFSAATALAKQIIEEGEPALERYIVFLKAGGSGYPLDLLKAAGIDMTGPQPVQAALDLFSRLLDHMESIVTVHSLPGGVSPNK